MGARIAKMKKREEQGNNLGGSLKSQLKMTKKRKEKSGEGGHRLNFKGSEEGNMKKKSLWELHMNPPPAFRKFESEVDWQNMDEDIALQLWEDVFKPLYTFYEVRRISNDKMGS